LCPAKKTSDPNQKTPNVLTPIHRCRGPRFERKFSPKINPGRRPGKLRKLERPEGQIWGGSGKVRSKKNTTHKNYSNTAASENH